MLEQIHQSFSHHKKIVSLTEEVLANKILTVVEAITACFKSGGKILCCGNGGSACDAEHFVAELVNRFQKERINLPAIALTANTANLTAIANDYDFAEIFSKQINALGKAGDILFVISTSGNSNNISRAVTAAQAKNLQVIALTGNSGGKLIEEFADSVLALQVPTDETPRIQEMHILIIHVLCELIDTIFAGL